MRVIVLAAGQGYKLDNHVKLLIKHPKTGKTVLDNYIEIFGTDSLTIVVGFKALQIMELYPNLKYVHNDMWSETKNSYSLTLALNSEPSIVLSSDMFFDSILIDKLRNQPGNYAITSSNQSRSKDTISCKISNNKITDIYKGFKSPDDPELTGIFKIEEKEALLSWKDNCRKNPNSFIGENLPFESFKFQSISIDDLFFRK